MRTWLVLAGGESSRFAADGRYGPDKLTAALGDASVAEATIAAVRQADPEAPIRVLGSEFGGGPARAVIAALPNIETSEVGVIAADMPFCADVITRLCKKWQPEFQALVPTDDNGREQWLCAIYSTDALREASRKLAEKHSWNAFVQPLAITRQREDIPMWDIDTVQDFENARRVWSESSRDE